MPGVAIKPSILFCHLGEARVVRLGEKCAVDDLVEWRLLIALLVKVSVHAGGAKRTSFSLSAFALFSSNMRTVCPLLFLIVWWSF